MEFAKEVLLDRLKRAYETEGMKADILKDLCQPEGIPSTLADELRREIYEVLSTIHEETKYHQQVILSLLSRLGKKD